MLYLDEAILTRWNAKGLSASIPGGVWHGGVPESVVLGLQNGNWYCIWTDVSDSRVIGSTTSRVQNCLVQFQVVATQDVICGQLCELIEKAFLNSNQAASNPLTLAGVGPEQDSILSCQVLTPYVIEDSGDTVNTGTMTLAIQYARAAGLRPA
jgi:hypothetical protein